LLGLCLAGATISILSNRTLIHRYQALDHLDPLDKQRLVETIHLRQRLGDLVWPGFGQAEIPLLVWNQEYSFLTGLAETPPGWEAVAGDELQGQPIYRKRSQDPQNFAVPVGETYAASLATKGETDAFLQQVFRDFLPPVIEDVFPYRVLIQPSEVQISGLIHEAFHVFQQLNAPERLAAAEAAHRQGEAYWQADQSMDNDWKNEIDLLAKAVQAESDEQARLLASQFLDQRTARRMSYNLAPPLVDYERQLEWEEGLAKYIELAIWRMAYEHTGYIAALPGDPDFKGYRTFPKRWNQELSQMKRQAGREGEVRFYYSGMAQAFLLDRLAPGWKASALQEEVWLEDLLRSAAP
jgi:hypothetical protein